ncbi:MAG: large-conductance mechanosensitive channel protein MscL [Oscillospiraceae bacterium]|nr:large-conductance mechanosensitive channel protein MscL [Oscillospiraceae bacterium]
MKKFMDEFKAFAMRGNVLDMAVGVVIGGAFGKITTSLVNDIIMPVVSLLTGGIDFSQWKLVLRQAVVTAAGEVQDPEVAVHFGNLIAVVLDFLIIAFVIFCMIKVINKFHRKAEEPAPEPAPTEPSAEEKLLIEIRDLLKEAHDVQGKT